jgi:hypothetical protein
MPPEILVLIDNPVLVIGLLCTGFLAGVALENFARKQNLAEWRRRNAWRWQKKQRPTTPAPATPMTTALEQLRTVKRAKFKPQALLNKSEAQVFSSLNKIIEQVAPDWRVMAQVSLGEVLRCNDEEAYRCINSKRVDILLIDGDCRPLHAIEYQGRGHYQGTAAVRDTVKKEALLRAGIGYVEVVAGDTRGELKRVVARLVGEANATNEGFGRRAAGSRG